MSFCPAIILDSRLSINTSPKQHKKLKSPLKYVHLLARHIHSFGKIDGSCVIFKILTHNMVHTQSCSVVQVTNIQTSTFIILIGLL